MVQYNLLNSDDVRVCYFISNMERAWRNTTCLIPIILGLDFWHMLSWSQTNFNFTSV